MLTRIASSPSALCNALAPAQRHAWLAVIAISLVAAPVAARAQVRPAAPVAAGAQLAQPATQTGKATAAGPSGDVTSKASSDAERLVPLGPGDSVTIAVFGQPDMTTTTYVANDGSVRVPLAGSVQVAGDTAVQAAQKIAEALKSGGYFVDPVVTVTLVQTRNERVSVLGEVQKPGTYAIDPSTTVFDLLAQAGGETPNGADVVYVRRHESDGRVQSYPVDLQGLAGAGGGRQAALAAENQAAARRLEGGDELYVPQAEHFYIYGEVASPNSYKLEPGLTMIQAIARAGGITPRGSSRRIEVKRLGKDGKYVVSRASADELVQADDVIRVKESIF